MKQLLNLEDVVLSLLGQLVEGLAVRDRRLPAGHRHIVDLQAFEFLSTEETSSYI